MSVSILVQTSLFEGNEWLQANQRYLAAAIERIRRALEAKFKLASSAQAQQAVDLESLATTMERLPAIEQVAANFGLSPFERDLLLLCAGVELDSGFAAICASANGGRSSAPTFALALSLLEGAHWSALAPTGRLRYWKMIYVEPGESLATSKLRIDERILHHLTGLYFLDEQLQGVVEPWPAPDNLPQTQRAIADRIFSLWSNTEGAWPPVQLCGEEEAGLEDVAATACAMLNMSLYLLRARDVPPAAEDREALLRLYTREAVLAECALLLVMEGDESAEMVRSAGAFVARLEGARLIAGRQPLKLSGRQAVRFDVSKPTAAEQGELWRASLGTLGIAMNGQIDSLVSQFNLGRIAIQSAGDLFNQGETPHLAEANALLWETCRAQSRTRLNDLAQRIESSATWLDLVLPAPQLQILNDVVAHVRQRAKVYERWGFAAKSSRGLGISALFAGLSGTGKTLAAEILANELHLDLFKIDLSQVVSKYIGETEKNLRQVFDAAESGGAVLLFDEADALFGKRSEVKDSHDRYANIEVSYLLQRMEAYRGLAILTTNMKQALDTAFIRRIRFIVQFPFPEAEERAEIWRRIFPEATPVEGLNYERLARLNVAGGVIRNIALGAAFIAAERDAPVRMEHLLRAARAEYAKLERSLSAAEIAGWA